LAHGRLPADQTVIDFGCGVVGDHVFLNRQKGGRVLAVGYDPVYHPDDTLLQRKYDIALCTYVLCTIPDELERLGVIARLHSLLNDGGMAYITVRNGKDQTGFRRDGSWQGLIRMDWPVLCRTGEYVIYHLWRHAPGTDPFRVEATTRKGKNHANR
jgi:hypothetical protein